MPMKIYIDCGAHKGSTIKAFLKKYQDSSEYRVIAIDPTPSLAVNYPDCVEVISKAVWVYDGKIDFYNTKNKPASAAGTVFKSKKTGKLDKKHPARVPCMDLSQFIADLPEAHIVLKMNIEGAEYPVLDKMISDGTINKVAVLYVKWHHTKIKKLAINHNDLIDRLLGIPSLCVYQSNIDEKEASLCRAK